MNELFDQLTALFAQLPQPVLVMEGTTLLYQNPAAQAQLTLYPETVAALTEGVAALGGRNWTVAEQELAGYRVLTLQPADAAAQLPMRLLDVVAQTLRGPLSTAMSVAQILFPRLEDMEDPRIQRETAALNRSFYQMLRLAGNLSDLSLYLRGKRMLKRQKVEINDWLLRLGERLQPYCQLRQLKLEVQTADERCFITMDADEVERAVLNLISNAMKFTPEGGHILLRLEIGRTQIRIKVLDDGEGLGPEIMESLYWRMLDRRVMGDSRWGVGLGMQLVRQVAAAHGGTVLAERRESGGTSVTISLERDRGTGSVLRSPVQIDYSGGFDRVLLELSDVLPVEVFESREIN